MNKESKISKELVFYLFIIGFVVVAMTVMGMKACGSSDAYSSNSNGSWLSRLFSSDDEKARRDSAVINSIQQHSRLYTAEVTSNKTITYTSNKQFKFKIAGVEKTINLPLGKTEAIIPVSVKYKAFIDLDRIGKNDIRIEKDTAIYITLPDPTIEETAVSVDHEHEKMKKQWLAKGLTYEEYQQLVRQAKDEAWEELSEEDQRAIIETAKVSATDLIIPQLRSLGFTHIEVNYRKEFKIFKVKG